MKNLNEEPQLKLLEVPAVRRPVESASLEGNLAELPLWVLHNRAARPKSGEDCLRTLDLGAVFDVEGRELQRTVTITADPRYGFPTMFGLRVLLAILEEGRDPAREELRLSSMWQAAKIIITRHRIAKRLNYKAPSAKDLEHIEQQCLAMVHTRLEFNGTWYDKKDKSRAYKRATTLLADVNLDPNTQQSLPGIEGRQESSVTLGPMLLKSLQDGYFNGVDLDYMNALRNPLPQRLYAYLTKQDGSVEGRKRTKYVEGLKKIAAKIDLKKRMPSAVYDVLAPALDQLTTPVMTAKAEIPRRFLENWNIDREKQQLSVAFFDEEASRVTAEAARSLAIADG